MMLSFSAITPPMGIELARMVIRAEHRRRVLEQSVDAPVHLLEGFAR